jgi:hypothetical protein
MGYSYRMPSAIAQRIERQLGFSGLVEALSKRLPPSDLQSLLIEVYRNRADPVKEAGILAQFGRDPLLAPSTADAREFLAFDSAAYEAAAEFAAVELSPVSPFGAAFALGGTSQNNVLTTIRNSEALGDSTIALALEAARRRGSNGLVRLCASHRVIRLQPFDVPGFSPHFRLFALVTGGRDTGNFRFEMEQLLEHSRVYLRLFGLLPSSGFELQFPIVEFTDMNAVEETLAAAGVGRDEVRESIRAHRLGGSETFLRERGIALAQESRHPLLESGVIEPLRDEFPAARFRVNQQRLEGFGYYRAFALRLSVQAPDGNIYPIADGGFTDWTARLLGNKKERLLISGIGSELVCKIFKAGSIGPIA